MVPDDAESCGWYWLQSPLQTRPVIGFYVSGLHVRSGVPGWKLDGRWSSSSDLALRGWRIVGPCLLPSTVEAMCAASYVLGRLSGAGRPSE